MDTIVEKPQTSRKRRIKHTAKPLSKQRISILDPHEMTDKEWNDELSRMRDVIGKAFANVDVDEYVNSFRR